MFFEHIFRELEKKKIRYLVIGGVAVNLHGYSRITGDLDMMLSMDEDNLKRFIDMVKSLGFKPKVPVGIEDLADAKTRESWIKEKNMKVFTVYNPKKELEHIDIMVEDYLDFEKAYRNREVMSAGNFDISVMSVSDLIQLKKIAGRARDQLDLQALLKIKELKNAKKEREG